MNEILLFGGECTDSRTGKVQVHADLYKFNCDKLKWAKISSPNGWVEGREGGGVKISSPNRWEELVCSCVGGGGSWCVCVGGVRGRTSVRWGGGELRNLVDVAGQPTSVLEA